MVSCNCGLFFIIPDQYGHQRRTYLPQLTAKSHTTIQATSYTTLLRQTFSNPLDQNHKQTSYEFPLYDGIAVTSFTCTIGDRKIFGKVEEKEKARKTFKQAVDRGESAGLLSTAPAGIFTISVGNIPARSNVVVDIEYGGELKHDAQIDGIRFTLPTAIAPRYGSYPGDVLGLGTTAQQRGIQIDVDLDLAPMKVTSLRTTSTTFESLLTPTFATEKDGRVLAASASILLIGSEMTEDFVLLAEVDGIGKPQALLDTSHDCNTVMATFVPKFKLPNIKPEIVFVADQSGSMAGGKTKSLVDALTVFLKSLPAGAVFNICAFGSRYDFVFKTSQPYTQETATQALNYVKTFRAQYGGTELQRPIEDVFKKYSGNHPLEIILLTDGEIWGEEPLFDFINDQIIIKKVDARLFCLGFGRDVSHTLVEGVARASRGLSQFVTDKENLDQKVVRMLKASLSPHFKDVAIKLNHDEEEFEVVESAGNHSADETSTLPLGQSKEHVSTSLFDQAADLDTPIPGSDDEVLKNTNTTIDPFNFTAPHDISLFPFSRTTVFGMTSRTSTPPVSLTLTAKSSSGPLELTIPIEASHGSASIIRKLAARTFVHDLEQGRLPPTFEAKFNSPTTRTELLQKAITNIGEIHQIPTKYTSYVAVEDKISQGLPPEGEAPPSYGGALTPSSFGGAQPRMMRMSAIPPPPPAPAPASSFQGFGTPSVTTSGGLFGSRQSAVGKAFGSAPVPAPAPAPGGGGTGIFGGLFGGSRAASKPQAAAYGAPSASSAGAFGVMSRMHSDERSRDRGRTAPSPPGMSAQLAQSSIQRRAVTDDDDDSDGEDTGALRFLCDRDSDGSDEEDETNANRFLSSGGSHQSAARKKKSRARAGGRDEDVSTLSIEERLRIIISEQSFDGFWAPSVRLLQALQLDVDTAGMNPELITVLVLIVLEEKFDKLEEVWELCGDKAEAWLGSKMDGKGFEKMKETARRLL
ncbi:von Willebrand factor type A domain-containing protein [Elsinoe ampelina]|uniref:von Willebrand factor type A domain-containing protein n=1 Tax=Elsinoe ampelina TaxID=302913 RepID=A0A6A6GEN8_9PEZI|nr:von Willebrand factor type A domain-containing protein [Elsinoe ampelina]